MRKIKQERKRGIKAKKQAKKQAKKKDRNREKIKRVKIERNYHVVTPFILFAVMY